MRVVEDSWKCEKLLEITSGTRALSKLNLEEMKGIRIWNNALEYSAFLNMISKDTAMSILKSMTF